MNHKSLKKFKLILLLFNVMGIILISSCNRGTGCPAEEANVKLDKKGNPRSKTTSGLFDKKGRMNSKGYKSDHRKPKIHKN